jgi:hypothetical protein
MNIKKNNNNSANQEDDFKYIGFTRNENLNDKNCNKKNFLDDEDYDEDDEEEEEEEDSNNNNNKKQKLNNNNNNNNNNKKNYNIFDIYKEIIQEEDNNQFNNKYNDNDNDPTIGTSVSLYTQYYENNQNDEDVDFETDIFLLTELYQNIHNDMIPMIKSDEIIINTNNKLQSLCNISPAKKIIPIQLLCSMRLSGLINMHLKNELRINKFLNETYLICKLISKRFSIESSPYKCIIIILIFKKEIQDLLLENSYKESIPVEYSYNSAGEKIFIDTKKQSNDTIQINEKSTTEHTDIKFIDEISDIKESNRIELEKQEIQKYDALYGSKKMTYRLPVVRGSTNKLEKIEEFKNIVDSKKKEMKENLCKTYSVHTWFYNIEDIKLKDEILQIPMITGI